MLAMLQEKKKRSKSMMRGRAPRAQFHVRALITPHPRRPDRSLLASPGFFFFCSQPHFFGECSVAWVETIASALPWILLEVHVGPAIIHLFQSWRKRSRERSIATSRAAVASRRLPTSSHHCRRGMCSRRLPPQRTPRQPPLPRRRGSLPSCTPSLDRSWPACLDVLQMDRLSLIPIIPWRVSTRN